MAKPRWVIETEKQLKRYPDWRAKAQLEKEQLDSLFPSCISMYEEAMGGRNNTSSTEKYGIKRIEISEEAKKARAIEIALSALGSKQREVIQRIYFDEEYIEDVCIYMVRAEKTIRRWKNSGVKKVAEILKIKK